MTHSAYDYRTKLTTILHPLLDEIGKFCFHGTAQLRGFRIRA